MAVSYHVRSNSLPSSPNPLAAQVNEHFSRLRSSKTTSTSSSSICQKLNALQDLHICIDKMLQLSLNQEALSQDQNREMIETILDDSLRFLDACNMAKDGLSLARESLSYIQSVIRRKRDVFMTEAKKYLASRKSLKRAFQRISKSLKTTVRAKCNNVESLVILKEAEAVTVAVFDSLLWFVSSSKAQPKPSSKWSLVSKLVNQKTAPCEEEESKSNEFSKVDAALLSLVESKSEKKMKIEDLQCLEMCIEDLELPIECLFRSLIKVRVSVLNVLGQ